MAYLFLAGAICAEVAATMSLRAAEGLSRPGYLVVVAVGYVSAFVLLSFALERGLALGIAYAIWAAAGVAAIAVLSIPAFGETLNAVQIGGLALVIAGVIALELGASH